MCSKVRTIFFCACFCFSSAIALASQGPDNNFLKGYSLGGWKIDFGIDDRVRYEYRHDFDFNQGIDDNGSLIFNRLIVNSRATLKDKYEIFIEGLYGSVGSYDIKKTAQKDALDLHQAYIRMNNVAALPFDLKLGRQEMKYGKGRLIWAASWSNRIASFDAGVLHYKAKNFWVDLFAGSVVNYDDNNFNRHEKKQVFSGIYSAYQKGKEFPAIEAYFLSLVDWSRFAKSERYTIGAHLQAELIQKIILDMEIPYQFGKDAGLDIRAYAFHFDVSRAFDTLWKPKVTVEYNLASGDKKRGDNKNNTFIPLYQSTHEPYGIMDFFRWQNLREAALNVSLSPYKKWKVIPGINFFWLDSKWDSWYNSSGSRVRTDASGQANTFVGEEASVVVKYDLNDFIKLESGYAHFFSGTFVKDTGANDGADWLYFQFQVKI